MGTQKPAGISEKVIRLLEIYIMIASGRHPSVASLMEPLNVSERTVLRCLEQFNVNDAIDSTGTRTDSALPTVSESKSPAVMMRNS